MAIAIEVSGRPRAGAAQGVLLACATVLIVIAISPLFPILPKITEAFAGNRSYAALAPAAVVLPSLFIGLLSIPAGILGDRVGRRRLLIAASLLFAVAAPLPYVLHSFPALLLCRGLTGVALSAVITAAVGLTGDYFPPAERQRWLALQSGLPALAAIVCGALGGMLGDLDWRLTLLLNGLGLVFAAGVLLLTSDRLLIDDPAPAVASAAADAAFPWRVILGIGAMLIWSSLVLFPIAYEIGFLFAERQIASSTLAGLGSASLALGAVAGAFVAAVLPAGLGSRKLLVAFACGGAGMLAFTHASSLPIALGACVVSGMSHGIVVPVLATSLLNGTPEVWRGRGVGVFQATLYLAQFASPLVSRSLSRSLGGAQAMKLYGGAALLTAAALLVLSLWRSRDGARAGAAA